VLLSRQPLVLDQLPHPHWRKAEDLSGLFRSDQAHLSNVVRPVDGSINRIQPVTREPEVGWAVTSTLPAHEGRKRHNCSPRQALPHRLVTDQHRAGLQKPLWIGEGPKERDACGPDSSGTPLHRDEMGEVGYQQDALGALRCNELEHLFAVFILIHTRLCLCCLV
jgi:hypothetical protein